MLIYQSLRLPAGLAARRVARTESQRSSLLVQLSPSRPRSPCSGRARDQASLPAPVFTLTPSSDQTPALLPTKEHQGRRKPNPRAILGRTPTEEWRCRSTQRRPCRSVYRFPRPLPPTNAKARPAIAGTGSSCYNGTARAIARSGHCPKCVHTVGLFFIIGESAPNSKLPIMPIVRSLSDPQACAIMAL